MEIKDNFKDIDKEKMQFIFDIKTLYDENKISLKEAQEKLKEKVSYLKAYEIAYIEQKLKQFDKDECKKENIQETLKLFDGLLIDDIINLDEEHPISKYKQENIELEKILKEIEDLIQYPLIKNQWLDIYERLMQIKIHYSRKQMQLYSILEKKGFDRPTTTMWTLDNFIKDEINKAFNLLNEDKEDEFIKLQITIVNDIRDLISKEEKILYPTSLKLINEEEFEEMKIGDKEIGYAWIKTNESKKENKNEFTNDLLDLLKKHGVTLDTNKELDVAQGKLTLEQINLIYKHMPVDLSFVDENDLVKFYTDTKHRVFPRSKNVIGRDVKNCHPRESVHIVEEIINKFRNKEQKTAEFWINKPDKFIYIYYTAVYDDNGNFKGVLEMMQDCTRIRNFKDSRTLLTWDDEENTKINNIDNSSTNDVENININIYDIDENTYLKDLILKYPLLKDEIIKLYPKAKLLNSPLAKVILPIATLKKMSERLDINTNEFIEIIKSIIKKIGG